MSLIPQRPQKTARWQPTRSKLGLLDSFERGLERAVNGTFAKTFKSSLAPIEITAALRRELDTKAAVVSRDRILVPNSSWCGSVATTTRRCPRSAPP